MTDATNHDLTLEVLKGIRSDLAGLREEVAGLRADTNERFERLEGRFERLKAATVAGFKRIDERLDCTDEEFAFMLSYKAMAKERGTLPTITDGEFDEINAILSARSSAKDSESDK